MRDGGCVEIGKCVGGGGVGTGGESRYGRRVRREDTVGTYFDTFCGA